MKKFNLSIAAHPEQWKYDLNKFEFFFTKGCFDNSLSFFCGLVLEKEYLFKKNFIYLGRYLNPTSEYIEFHNLKHPAYLRFDT